MAAQNFDTGEFDFLEESFQALDDAFTEKSFMDYDCPTFDMDEFTALSIEMEAREQVIGELEADAEGGHDRDESDEVNQIAPFPTAISTIPSMNRRESAEEFPYKWTSLVNYGDFGGLHNLAKSCLDKRCVVTFSYNNSKLSWKGFAQFFARINEAHPDHIMQLMSSEINGDKINSTIQVSFTDCKSIYEATARKITNPSIVNLFPRTRVDTLKAKLNYKTLSRTGRREMDALLKTNQDLAVRGYLYSELTIDKTTGKIVALHMRCDFRHVQAAPPSYPQEQELESEFLEKEQEQSFKVQQREHQSLLQNKQYSERQEQPQDLMVDMQQYYQQHPQPHPQNIS